MNAEYTLTINAYKAELGDWHKFRRAVRLPHRKLVAALYVMTAGTAALLLVQAVALHQQGGIDLPQLLLLVGLALANQPYLLGGWLYVLITFALLLLASSIVGVRRYRTARRLYRGWIDGTNSVDTLYMEPLIDNLCVVYTAQSVPTAALPVMLARFAYAIQGNDDCSQRAANEWQEVLQTASRQLITRQEMLAKVIQVTRPFGSVAPVDITTTTAQRQVRLLALPGGHTTVALGMQAGQRTVFFKLRLATPALQPSVG